MWAVVPPWPLSVRPWPKVSHLTFVLDEEDITREQIKFEGAFQMHSGEKQ